MEPDNALPTACESSQIKADQGRSRKLAVNPLEMCFR